LTVIVAHLGEHRASTSRIHIGSAAITSVAATPLQSGRLWCHAGAATEICSASGGGPPLRFYENSHAGEQGRDPASPAGTAERDDL